ncbi:MAG: hypothetical protein II363_04855 [Clostridia bacterium]|nr:hypothetical protein [Clostridia bacterium]
MNKKEHTPRPRLQQTKTQIQEHPLVFAVYVVLRIIVMVSMGLSALRQDWESVFVCALVLVLFVLPAFLEKRLRIELPSLLEIIILLFIFASEILGELQSYYMRFFYWDTLLHAINGFICAAFGFSLVDILNRNKQTKFYLSPLYMAITALCFSMTIGVLWEFFEYGMDILFHTDMQKDTIIKNIHTVTLDATMSNRVVLLDNIHTVTINGRDLGLDGYLDIGLYDTMGDLLVNFIGAVLFSIVGYIYIKKRGQGTAGHLVEQFIPTLREEVQTDEEKRP